MGEEDYSRYSRQIALPGFGVEGQRGLSKARVVILGMGALGSALADGLARAGVGRLLLVDRDYLELHNLQRQTLYTEADVSAGLPKAIAAARRLAEVNSKIEIEPLVIDVDAANIEGIVAGATLALDGSDNFALRYLLNDAALKHGVPWVYSAVLGTSGMSMAIKPGVTPCLRCVYPDAPAPGSTPTCETAGVLGAVVQAVAGVSAAAALKLLLEQEASAGLLALDLWQGSFDRLDALERDPDCPACGRRNFEFLGAGPLSKLDSVRLCGRATVQLQTGGKMDLAALAARMRASGAGQVIANPYLLRLILDEDAGNVAGWELTAFADGRVIVKGTEEPAQARNVVARFIGI